MRSNEAIRQKKFESPLQKAVLDLIYTASWPHDQQRRVFQYGPIGLRHFNAMRILKGTRPKTVTPGEVGTVMLDKAPDVTRWVDKLVALGWAKRDMAAEDRRTVRVGITQWGVEKIDELNVIIDQEALSMKGRPTNKKAARLSELPDKLRG
jgi:DNA-binding MarR family transcriptional regulator